MKKIIQFIFSRTMMFGLMALAQILIIGILVMFFSSIGTAAYLLFTVASLLIIIGLLEKDDLNPAYKIMWIILVVIFPITGAVFYIMCGGRSVSTKKAKTLALVERRAASAMVGSGEVGKPEGAVQPLFKRFSEYLRQNAAAPVYSNTTSKYFAWGEDFFESFLQEAEKAEKFIFMEYFIIEEGEMWNKSLELLEKKAAAGVDVRIIYDSFGCLFTLPDKYEEKLRRMGIKCEVFNPLQFSVHFSDYTMLNHRDHRKITVIDGNVGFTGGLNFADEYINAKVKHGKWKDTGFMLKGDGVYPLTVTFLKMWDFITGCEVKYNDYMPTVKIEEASYVQPYCDSPVDGETVSEYAYLNIIQAAQKYVYIVTPYLVIDHELITALSLAAKSGVDVRIITPGIPDKWYAYYVTQSFYPVLLKAGVKIFQYTPGFVHAKMYVCDDEIAVVGSANMDYRSLYLHFENCCAFFSGDMPKTVKLDFDDILSECEEIDMLFVKNTNFFKRLMQVILRFFAPMM